MIRNSIKTAAVLAGMLLSMSLGVAAEDATLDEITIRVIENEELSIDVNAIELPEMDEERDRRLPLEDASSKLPPQAADKAKDRASGKASQAADKAKDKASDKASQAADKAKDKASDKASQAADKAKDKAKEKASNGKGKGQNKK